MVEERRGSDVNQVNFRTRQQRADILNVRNAETLGDRKSGFAMSAGHAGQFHSGNLVKMLQRKEAKAPCANYPDADGAALHNEGLNSVRRVTMGYLPRKKHVPPF